MRYRYRSEEELKDSGIEWIGKIPKDWERVRIGHICEIGRGRVISNEEIQENKGEYPVYSSQTKDNGVMGYISTFDFEGDYVTWTTDGANAGTVFKRSGKFNCTNVCGTLKNIKKELNLNYLAYALSIETKPYVRLDINPKLMNNEMSNIKVCITNSIEQEKIANFLDEKTSQFDLIISKKEELIKKLEEAKKSLISEVVTGKVKVVKTDDGYEIVKRTSEEMKDSGVEWLGKIPKDWEVKKLKHMAIINPPKSSVKNFLKDDIEVSFVPMDSVRLGYINLNKTKKISEVIDGYTLFEEDDIIMAKVTPCFENRNIAICKGLKNKIGFGSSELNTIRLNDKHDISYMFYHLQEQVFMDISTYEMTGSGGLKRVPTSFLLNSQFAYPSITEKELILSFLENNISVVDTTINKTKFQIEKLKEAKQSLISEAVTGKIEILD